MRPPAAPAAPAAEGSPPGRARFPEGAPRGPARPCPAALSRDAAAAAGEPRCRLTGGSSFLPTTAT